MKLLLLLGVCSSVAYKKTGLTALGAENSYSSVIQPIRSLRVPHTKPYCGKLRGYMSGKIARTPFFMNRTDYPSSKDAIFRIIR